MRIKRLSITEILVKAMLLFSIISVIRGISILEDINKIWVAFLSIVLLVRLCFYKYSPWQVVILYLTILLHLIALYFTDFPLYHTNILFYFLLWVLIFLFFVKSKEQILESLRNRDGFIRLILWSWTILVGISALMPSCYIGSYFVSFAQSSFRLMPAVLIVAAAAMYMAVSRKDRRYEWFLILPTYAGFMNSSRTYFAVYVLLLLMYLYMRFKSKRNFYLMLLPILGAIVLLMVGSGIMDKFESVRYTEKSYLDFWGTFTNGRTVFWRWDLEAFFALPLWQQFVGKGFNFAYEVTDYYGTAIWAHNDIINLLMNFGYIGVVIYLWAYDQLIKAYMPKTGNIPPVVRWLFHGAVWFNSMMNMSYTYICAVISYPLLLCVIYEFYEADHNKALTRSGTGNL